MSSLMSNQITLQVNGETCTCSSQSRSDLLEQLGFNPRLVAVEYNQKFCTSFGLKRRCRKADRLEVVTIVGGG